MKKALPYLYTLPAVLLAIVFIYYPSIISFGSSFFNLKLDGSISSFSGFKNYIDVLKDENFYSAFLVTLKFTLLYVPLLILLLLASSYLTSKGSKLDRFFQVIYILPMALGLSSASLVFKFIFSQDMGILNRLFFTVPWDSNGFFALLSIVFLSVFLSFGLGYILLLCAFKNVDRSVVEASALDGCSSFQTFSFIKIPLIMPTLSFVVFIALKDAALISAPIMIMRDGGPYGATQTLVYYYYLEAFKNYNYAAAAASSAIIFLISLSLILLYGLFKRRVKW